VGCGAAGRRAGWGVAPRGGGPGGVWRRGAAGRWAGRGVGSPGWGPRRQPQQIQPPLGHVPPPIQRSRLCGGNPRRPLRRRDPQDHLQHECDRAPERPLPAGRPGSWPLAQRAGHAEVSLPAHTPPVPRAAGVLEPRQSGGRAHPSLCGPPNRAQRAPLRGLSIYRAIASDADNPALRRDLQHRDVAVRRPHDTRARGRPRANFPPIPAASWPRGRPGPRAHAETTRTPGDIGPGELPGTPRDLKTARSLRQGEDHLSGIPRFASEPRQNRSSATKGSGGMRSRVRRRAPVRFCWKRRHDMGSLIDNCSSCSSPQVSA
jgi:hypothetical protein